MLDRDPCLECNNIHTLLFFFSVPELTFFDLFRAIGVEEEGKTERRSFHKKAGAAEEIEIVAVTKTPEKHLKKSKKKNIEKKKMFLTLQLFFLMGLVSYCALKWLKYYKVPKAFPPGPPAIPILGVLPFINVRFKFEFCVTSPKQVIKKVDGMLNF